MQTPLLIEIRREGEPVEVVTLDEYLAMDSSQLADTHVKFVGRPSYHLLMAAVEPHRVLA